MEENYFTAKERYDLYSLFTEKGLNVTRSEFGFIIPFKFLESKAGKPLRNLLTKHKILREVVLFEEFQVFEEGTTYSSLIFLSKKGGENFKIKKALNEKSTVRIDEEAFKEFYLDYSRLKGKWNLSHPNKLRIIDKVKKYDKNLDSILDSIFVGIQTSANDIFYMKQKADYAAKTKIDCKTKSGVKALESELLHPVLLGKDIKRFTVPEDDRLMIYPYKKASNETKLIPESELRECYHNIYNYLTGYKEQLTSRGSTNQEFESWYAHWCPVILKERRPKSSLHRMFL